MVKAEKIRTLYVEWKIGTEGTWLGSGDKGKSQFLFFLLGQTCW